MNTPERKAELAKQLKNAKDTLLQDDRVQLVAVSKTKPQSDIEILHGLGQLDFGENRAQEMQQKAAILSTDIRWHFIGYLQRNKIKYIINDVHLIHSIDRASVLKAVDQAAQKADRCIDVLLQFHIATEESKTGFEIEEVLDLIKQDFFQSLNHVRICGVMGMATFTDDQQQVRAEFRSLKNIFDQLKREYFTDDSFKEISMGMSGDAAIAIEEGSTMIRVGSAIFGSRN